MLFDDESELFRAEVPRGAPTPPDWLQRLDRLFHALVLRHVQGDLTWVGSRAEKTTCECGRIWRLNWGL